MRLKRKYQVGGIVYTPFLPTRAGSPQENVSGGTSTSSSSDNTTGAIKKEVINLLKENGMPSDVKVFLQQANSFLSGMTHLSQSSLFGGTSDDYDLSDLIKIQQAANDIKYNNNLRNEAVKQITSESAGSEVAITNSGLIYVQTEDGEISKITPKEFKDNTDKYRPLTNNELLYYRENSPNLAFDTGTLNDLSNSIGMNSITKYLRDVIGQFGSDKVGGYTTKSDSVNKGLALLTEAGPDGYYKYNNEEELRDVNRALNYLYNGMSDNAKNLLRAKTAVEGGDPNDPNDISNLLLQALFEHTSRTNEVTFDKTATEYDPYKTGKAGGSSETQVKDTYPERLVSGDGLDPAQFINIMPANTGVTLHTYSQNAGPVLRDKENRMNNTNLQVVLSQGYGISGIVDAQSVTFGDQLINQNDYKRIMYDGSTNMKRVYLPVTYTTDGRITPNFDAQQKLEQVQSFIADNNGQVSDAWISNWLNENLPEARWNTQTKQVEFDPAYVKPFLVLHGIAARNRVAFDTNSNYLHHLSRDEGRQWKEDYDRIVTEESVLGKLEHNNVKGAGTGKYYSGNIYIPISGPVIGATIYNDQYFPRETYTDITQKAAVNQARQQMTTNW